MQVVSVSEFADALNEYDDQSFKLVAALMSSDAESFERPFDSQNTKRAIERWFRPDPCPKISTKLLKTYAVNSWLK
jgi:hypothetical protein